MARKYPAITFTDSVRAAQEHYGSRASGARLEASDADDEHLSQREAEFISQRDGFYLATIGGDDWPYVQFRGGPAGFLHVLDDSTLGYADFRGNLQYISIGNLRKNDRVALILMDYAKRQRLKIMARTEVFDADERPDLLVKLAHEDYRAKIERVVLLHVAAFDWNCPQHITPRFTEAEYKELNGE